MEKKYLETIERIDATINAENGVPAFFVGRDGKKDFLTGPLSPEESIAIARKIVSNDTSPFGMIGEGFSIKDQAERKALVFRMLEAINNHFVETKSEYLAVAYLTGGGVPKVIYLGDEKEAYKSIREWVFQMLTGTAYNKGLTLNAL